jgi:hypothetical protein
MQNAGCAVADDLVRRAADRLAGLDCRIRFVAGYSTLPGGGGRMDLPKRPHECLRSPSAV